MKLGFYCVGAIIRLGRLLSLIAGFSIGFSESANAESFQCVFKPSRIEKGLMPATLRIDWPDSHSLALITDTITKANGFNRVWTEPPVENSKRVRFSWKLKQIPVSNLSRLGGYSIGRVDVSYRATIFPPSNKIILTATIPAGNPVIVRTTGRCEKIE